MHTHIEIFWLYIYFSILNTPNYREWCLPAVYSFNYPRRKKDRKKEMLLSLFLSFFLSCDDASFLLCCSWQKNNVKGLTSLIVSKCLGVLRYYKNQLLNKKKRTAFMHIYISLSLRLKKENLIIFLSLSYYYYYYYIVLKDSV